MRARAHPRSNWRRDGPARMTALSPRAASPPRVEMANPHLLIHPADEGRELPPRPAHVAELGLFRIWERVEGINLKSPRSMEIQPMFWLRVGPLSESQRPPRPGSTWFFVVVRRGADSDHPSKFSPLGPLWREYLGRNMWGGIIFPPFASSSCHQAYRPSAFGFTGGPERDAGRSATVQPRSVRSRDKTKK